MRFVDPTTETSNHMRILSPSRVDSTHAVLTSRRCAISQYNGILCNCAMSISTPFAKMHSQKSGTAKTATSASRTPAGSSRPSVSSSSSATVVHLPPFCFECLDMDAETFETLDTVRGTRTTKTTQFYLISCGRMLCSACCAKEGMSNGITIFNSIVSD